MSIIKKPYGTADGREISSYTLENGGMSVTAINYGGIITSIVVDSVDVALGRDSLEEYFNNSGYLGAAIGRHANRIANGKFELNGQMYTVGANEGANSLHGGFIGWDKRVWDAEASEIDGDPSLILTLTSADGDEGFPGEVSVKMTYTLTKAGTLRIRYEAVSDKDTLVNMTNHTYFNLSGCTSESGIEDHVITINADFYTPNSADCMPTGEVLSVSGTPFDFRTPKPAGKDMSSSDEQIRMFGGYDHNYPINGFGFRFAAAAESPKTGIRLEVWTDRPSVQFYSGNGIESGRVYKGGMDYAVHQGLCFEPQCFPNAMSHSHYPNPILRAGERYDTVTEYRFSKN